MIGLDRNHVVTIPFIVFAYIFGCDKHEFQNPIDGGPERATDLDADIETGTSSFGENNEKDTNYNKMLTWVKIPGGTYMMGSEEFTQAQPVHEVTINNFEITKTEVTVGQYRECVNAGACEWPTSEDKIDVDSEYWCNYWGNEQENHPVNCMSWTGATHFCKWAGGRLLSEAEWEYAARSGGKEVFYPWGEEKPSCDRTVMEKYDPHFEKDEGYGCETGKTWPVCSKPQGNTEHGLCDMAGNVWELVQDHKHDNYEGAPDDGSAFESLDANFRVKRGGGYASNNISEMLHVSNRFGAGKDDTAGEEWGFRCARQL